MQQSISALLTFLLCAVVGLAQESAPRLASNSAPNHKMLEGLLERVSSLPPEYKADLGFTILNAAGTSLSPEQRQSLLGDIFHSATRVHYPYALHQASSQMPNDLIASILDNSKLDTLDIQAGAVERALPAEPQFADHLFGEMKLKEDRASCKDANVEDVSAFYTIAGKIIGDERIKDVSGEDKESYLMNLVASVRIPAEIAPLAELISRTPLKSDQLGQLEGAFDSALCRITATDREMTAAEGDGNLTHAIELLSSRFAQAGVYRGRLLAAYRNFLVRSLTPESCSDYSLDRTVVARKFNALIPESLANSPDLAPLTAAQLASETEGASAPKRTFAIDARVMTELYRIAGARVASSTEEYRTGQPSAIVPESSDVDNLIKYAIAPQPEPASDACPVCEFDAKGALLDALVQLLPPGSELQEATGAEVDFLGYSDWQTENPVVWLHLFKKLLNASRSMNGRAKGSLAARAKKRRLMPLDTPSAAASEIRESLHGSTNPIISTYVSADDLLKFPYLAKEGY